MAGYIITMVVCTLLIIILNFLGIAFCAGQTAANVTKSIIELLEKKFDNKP